MLETIGDASEAVRLRSVWLQCKAALRCDVCVWRCGLGRGCVREREETEWVGVCVRRCEREEANTDVLTGKY